MLSTTAAEFATALSTDAPLTSVVAELQRSSATVRAAFVDAAVTELTAAYAIAVSDAERQGLPGDADWIAGTQTYMSDLKTIAATVNGGADVRLLLSVEGSLRVVVASSPRRQFMLTAPRPHERNELERAVLTRFCQRVGCASPPYGDGVTLDHESAELPAITSKRGGDDGLRCKHDDARHGKLYRRACAQLKRELRALATALRASAHPIDWSILGRPRRQGADHALTINADGGLVVLHMPGLLQAPEALADAIPWIRALLAGKVTRFQLEPPARLVYGTQVAAR